MTSNKTIRTALYRLFRPLARMLISMEISYQQSSGLLKKAYIESAEDDFALPGRKPSLSRVSLITGLSRKAVHQVKSEEDFSADGLHAPNRAVKIVSAWSRDDDFITEGLAIGGEYGFAELVKQYSGDLPYRAVLDELLRIGIVAIDRDKKLTLLSDIYVPAQGQADKFDLLADGGRDYLTTAAFNLANSVDDAWMQLTVSYENLSEETVEQFKKISDQKTFELLQELDSWLSAKEIEDSTKKDVKCDRRVGLGVYYFEE